MSETSLTADALIDRRKMKRRLTFWRIMALLGIAAAIIGLLAAAGVFKNYGKYKSDHIARVKISGVITNDRPMLKLLETLSEKDGVKGVILDISTPGGSTVGGEAIYEAVRKLAEEKPVATSVGTLAASAGYMIASASDHIVARRSSIVGSIGVIFQYGQVSELLKKIGVEVNEVKSSPLKAEPSPFHPASPEAREMINKVVQDTYNWFVSIVAERRNMAPLKVRRLADGSIFTGTQGLENGLIDAIGDEDTALQWLVSENGLDEDLEILTWKPKRNTGSFLNNPASVGEAGLHWIAQKLGISPQRAAVREIRDALPKRLFLDGLVSMMQVNSSRETRTSTDD